MSDLAVIGGEFLLDSSVLKKELINDISPKYSLGRTCLYSILEASMKEVEEILCPDYICSSVTEVPHRIGIPIRHYHVLCNFLPDLESIRNSIGGSDEKKAIILVAYFGMIDLDDVIKPLRKEYPSLMIIIDDVQNYYGFGRHVDYDYCFSSCRKWFCTPDGADILQRNKARILKDYPMEPEYIQYKVAGNLLKNYSWLMGEAVALELISKGEALMDEDYLFRCSDIARELLKRTNFFNAEKKRKTNAAFLHGGLDKLGIEHLFNPDLVPFFVPIVVKDRDKLRKHLFSLRIFAPVHWPVDDLDLQGNNELYRKELSLICDQRYNEEDMERILKGIEDVL